MLSQRSHLAPDKLFENVHPIRSQIISLTQLLTLTTTQKFPLQAGNVVVDQFQNTNLSGVYALGDVAGKVKFLLTIILGKLSLI